MKIKKGQHFKNKNGALCKVLNPSVFDKNGEEYFEEDVFDPYKKEWCGANLRHYKRAECLSGLTPLTKAQYNKAINADKNRRACNY